MEKVKLIKILTIFICILVHSPSMGNTENYKAEGLDLVRKQTTKEKIKKIRQKKKSKIKAKRGAAFRSSINKRFRSFDNQKKRKIVGGVNPRDQKKIENRQRGFKRLKRVVRRRRQGEPSLPLPPRPR